MTVLRIVSSYKVLFLLTIFGFGQLTSLLPASTNTIDQNYLKRKHLKAAKLGKKVHVCGTKRLCKKYNQCGLLTYCTLFFMLSYYFLPFLLKKSLSVLVLYVITWSFYIKKCIHSSSVYKYTSTTKSLFI